MIFLGRHLKLTLNLTWNSLKFAVHAIGALKFDCNEISFERNLKGRPFGISDFSMTQPSCSLSAIKMRISERARKLEVFFPTENTNEKDGLSKDSGGSFSSSFFVVKFLIRRLKKRSVHNVPPPRWNERWRNERGENWTKLRV